MMGAPQQEEVKQKLVILDTLLSAFAGERGADRRLPCHCAD
jgi:hypothetical protein